VVKKPPPEPPPADEPPISPGEMVLMFGETHPQEVMNLINSMPKDTPHGELRSLIRKLAAQRKSQGF
jgi:hypothetical protein